MDEATDAVISEAENAPQAAGEPTSVQPPVEATLFELPERPAPEAAPAVPAKPRLRLAEREQVVIRTLSLDQMLPDDDEARVVWDFVCQSDLSPLLAEVRAVEGHVGRNATDPRILYSLWLFATLKGVGSARELDRLCVKHLSYQWICGDVSVNYHLLADFRVQHAEVLNQLFTEQVAALMHAGAVTLERVAQDGVRVRADAGRSSFRRAATLEECLAEAQQRVAELQRELEQDPAALSRREKAARQRAARERLERVKAAQEACAEVQAAKEKRGGDSLKNAARASTTDPEARNMKMANGGYNPAYNVQFSTDTASQVIVGVDATNQGTDGGQMVPMVEQLEQRTGVRPDEVLVDGGFATTEGIQHINDPQEDGTKVYTPVKAEEKQRQRGDDPFAPRRGESPELTEWRTRMGTDEAKLIYKERASTAECVNALARQRGLQQFRVRGLAKVRTVAILFALAHNLHRWGTLRAKGTLKVKGQ
jgi:transposase